MNVIKVFKENKLYYIILKDDGIKVERLGKQKLVNIKPTEDNIDKAIIFFQGDFENESRR